LSKNSPPAAAPVAR